MLAMLTAPIMKAITLYIVVFTPMDSTDNFVLADRDSCASRTALDVVDRDDGGDDH